MFTDTAAGAYSRPLLTGTAADPYGHHLLTDTAAGPYGRPLLTGTAAGAYRDATPMTPIVSQHHSPCARSVCSTMSRTAPRPPANSET